MKWGLTFFFIFMTFGISSLSLMKKRELTSFYQFERPISLTHFKTALKEIPKADKDHLAFWYGLISGNTQSLSKNYKEKYKRIGLSHAFTPSGFHLSAVLTPLNLLLPKKWTMPFLVVLSLLIFSLPGLDPLKRMGLIKLINQKFDKTLSLGISAIICLFLGQLNSSPLSFIFSFFFLGIIYSGLKNIALVIWFFIGQLLICFFQGESISFLNLLFSPLANFILGLITPVLFLLSYPLWDFTLVLGVNIIKSFDKIVELLYLFTLKGPSVEVHSFTIMLIVLMLLRKLKLFFIGLLLFSTTLNLEKPTRRWSERYYFEPSEQAFRIQQKDGIIHSFYQDGKCMERIVMGRWEKRCSPKRAPRKKKIKKLSYL